MPSSLERLSSSSTLATGGSRGSNLSRRTNRALTSLEERTLLRVADVQAEGYVATEKTKEINHLVREAMTGQAMLRKWGDVLSTGDPVTAGDMLFLGDIAKMANGEIIADTVDTYCREARR